MVMMVLEPIVTYSPWSEKSRPDNSLESWSTLVRQAPHFLSLTLQGLVSLVPVAGLQPLLECYSSVFLHTAQPPEVE